MKIDITTMKAQASPVDYLRKSHSSAGVNPRLRIQSIVVLVLLLDGCSLFLPHPDKSSNVLGDADTPQDGRCSLAVASNRRSLPDLIAGEGIPTPLIIHVRSSVGSKSRTVSTGQSVDFEASTNHASSAQAAQHSTAWRIQTVDARGEALADGAVLANGSVFALREDTTSGYLRLDIQAVNTTVPQTEASRFIIYKADVPDSTRPTTCDEWIRDEDFVFLRTLTPSAWASADPLGMLFVQEAVRGKPASSNPFCVRQEERCRTDSLGALVCVSAPVCGQ
jgi:hypothetical protein